MRLFLALFALTTVSVCRAADPEATIASLIAEVWRPREVRVEWRFAGKVPPALEAEGRWKIAEPRPSHLSGSVILALSGLDSSPREQTVTISGTARIFGPSLLPIRTIRAGEAVDSSLFVAGEAEWTRLRSDVLDGSALRANRIAARTLIPGRPLTAADLKDAPVIERDQAVQVEYEDGAVKITIRGRALQAGAVGEKIVVAVDLEKTRRVEGIVAADGVVRWTR
ncbi:MAG: flagellar basal body P-ring formation chaperone FlgA [bacterium]|nr:flagellar basal body P-ring formation chaperone FlgA [bacterium]